MPDDTDLGHSYYVQSVMQARANVEEAIDMAGEHFDPTVSKRSVASIEARDGAAVLHVRMHMALMNYHSQVGVRADDLGSLWTDPFYSDLSLATLGEYRFKFVEEPVVSGGGPRMMTTEVEKYRVLLPLEAVSAAKAQLDRCVDEIGLFPKKKKRPLYEVKRDPEDYDEPAKPGIPKPQ